MSEKKSSGCLKAFMIFLGASFLLTLALSGGGYYLWKKNGSPTLEKLQANLDQAKAQALRGAPEGGSASNESSGERPIVASAPIQAGPETYAQYVNRRDVLTLVNYYSDT